MLNELPKESGHHPHCPAHVVGNKAICTCGGQDNQYVPQLKVIPGGVCKVGIGGAPTRASTLPNDGPTRKTYPVASGVLDYFPDALVAIARVSWQGNEQHNPGQPLNWAREKSTDEADTMIRHFLQRGTLDTDGCRHTAKMAWRALAVLQKEIEEEQAATRAVTYTQQKGLPIPYNSDPMFLNR